MYCPRRQRGTLAAGAQKREEVDWQEEEKKAWGEGHRRGADSFALPLPPGGTERQQKCGAEPLSPSSTASTSDWHTPSMSQSPSPSVSSDKQGEELSPEEEASYTELERMLAAEPEPDIREHHIEAPRLRLLRWLRSSGFDAAATFKKLHAHATWWKEYGMDTMSESDELDEHGPMFACGEDRWGRPTIICRPCVHFAKDKQESLLTAKRCVYTLQACIERLNRRMIANPKIIVIYDCRDLCRRNLDLVFSRAVVPVIEAHFPERLERVLIINSHWTMNFFWSAISLLLAPEVKAKIAVSGSSSGSELLKFVGEDHPYLMYALKVSNQPSSHVPLPPRTPFEPVAAVESKAGEREEPPSPAAVTKRTSCAGCLWRI
mmetsp:Transcript_28805/g.72345  ORF Transcript_28805/g.72345 Transcript_28805/m.72345 type:complete len:376 (-) Transcript_28805:53-1180(-)